MSKKGPQSYLSMVISLVLIFSMISPAVVFADESTPEATTAGEQQPVVVETQSPSDSVESVAGTEYGQTQEAESTQVPEQTQAPEQTDAGVSVTEAATQVPSETSEPAATESATADETLPTQEATEVVEPEEVAEIAAAAAEEGVTLAGEDGDPLVMATEETADLLSDNPDPWVIRSGVTHRFLVSCLGQPSDATNTCTETSTPVQDAINFAVAGETVYLGAGTFVEDIEINKSITLQGTTGTIIQSPVDINVEYTNSNPQSPIVYVYGNATVVIDGITIDGNNNGNGNYRFTGITFNNASGTVSNCLIQGITESPLSGNQHGLGIYIDNSDGASRTVNVFNNTIQDFQKGGIVASGDGLTVNIDNNIVTGVGDTGSIAQNGIQVGYGATGAVTNNTVSEVGYTGANWGATAILLYEAGGVVTVSGNNIFNSENGINASKNSSMNVYDNLIYDSDWAIVIDSIIYDSSWQPSGYYPPTNSQIHGNTLLNNYVGYYGTDSSVVLRDNIFTGNDYGVYGEYENSTELGYGLYNYWGCDAGPDGGTGCDTAYGVSYDPWLIDPDGDGVFESSDGTGGYVDNCPLVANPDQADSDGDGIGDACDSTSGGGGATPTPAAPAGRGTVIPVTGGAPQTLVCPAGTDEVVLRMENGDQVRFIGLCSLDAALNKVGADALPGALPEGTTYVSDMLVQVWDQGTLLKVLGNGSIELTFIVPKDAQGKSLALMYWDEESETWMEIPMDTLEIKYPLPLLPDDPADQRVVLKGLSSKVLQALTQENFSGLFALVAK